MRRMQHVLAVIAVAALGTLVAFAQAPQQPAPGAPPQGRPGGAAPGRGGPAGPASFFITSVGKGDRRQLRRPRWRRCVLRCRWRPEVVWRQPPGRTWRAYLSMPAQGGTPAVNARDRNRRGTVVQRARTAESPTTSPICTATCSAIATASTRRSR